MSNSGEDIEDQSQVTQDNDADSIDGPSTGEMVVEDHGAPQECSDYFDSMKSSEYNALFEWMGGARGNVKEDNEEQRHLLRNAYTDEEKILIQNTPRYNDFYEWMGSAKELRPIAITDEIDWTRMKHFDKVFWCIGQCIQMVVLTFFSIRTDRFLQVNSYLKYHWKHYSGSVLKCPHWRKFRFDFILKSYVWGSINNIFYIKSTTCIAK